MKVFEVTRAIAEDENVQYQQVVDKGPKTPEQLAAINAQRAASGEQAAVVDAHKAQMASGLYAQPPGTPAAATTATTAPVAPKPPAPPKQPAAPAAASGAYTVKAGDTLGKIASQMGTNLQALLQANPQFKSNPNLIKPGQTVNPPGASAPTPGATVTSEPTKPNAAPVPAATPAAPAPAAGSNYYVQPAKVGMNGEMDYVVIDREKGVEVKSFDSQAEADAWIKQQPVAESLSRLLQVAGLK